MLFQSPLFMFVFLPVVLVGFAVAARLGGRTANMVWLSAVSLAFYAYWDVGNLLVLGASVLFNFIVGNLLQSSQGKGRLGRALMTVAVVANLVGLAYFKFSGFFNDMAARLFGGPGGSVVLPLAVSFFTFHQISYLLDIWFGRVRAASSFLEYLLYVTFFPQLLSGPIVRYRELQPQFAQALSRGLRGRDLLVGLAIFSIGLFKKAVIADSVSPYVDTVYAAAMAGEQIGPAAAWSSVFLFTFQVYFGFSGYTDMALGLARMLGMRLPINFDSPLKAVSIIDLWRRWHMSLTRFFADYVYTPISLWAHRRSIEWGLKGEAAFIFSTVLPVLFVFVLIGVWHGTGWTFVVFGLVQGALMVVAMFWQRARGSRKFHGRVVTAVLTLVTFGAFSLSLIFFRAQSMEQAMAVIAALRPWSGVSLFQAGLQRQAKDAFVLIAQLYLFVVLLPNTQEIMKRYRPALLVGGQRLRAVRPRWRMGFAGGLFVGLIMLVSVLVLRGASEFIYFQF